MRPEANPQHPGGRSSQGFSGLLASSGSLVAPLHRWSEERRNHTKHHQPQELTVRESGAGPEPLTFVDHTLRDGDSLVGLTQRQIAAFTWKRGALPPELELSTKIVDAVERVAALRREIAVAGRKVPQWELEDKWAGVEAALWDVRFFADLAVEGFFFEGKVKAREARRRRRLDVVLGWADAGGGGAHEYRDKLAEKRRADPPFAPFHWEVEFPEVFGRENPGFDAFVGNPPFAGKNTMAASNVGRYPIWLRELHSQSHGNSDLVAHFFRRAFDLLRDEGAIGLVATNTIGQGDTRHTGLRWICTNGGQIYDARTRLKWPGLAAVVVSVVHVAKGSWGGGRMLDGRVVDRITAYLFHAGDHEDPARLMENDDQSFSGSIVLGMGFTFDDTDTKGIATPLVEMRRLIAENPYNRKVILPYIGGNEVNSSPTHAHHRYVINFQNYPLRREDLGDLWRDAEEKKQDEWFRSGIVPLDYADPVAADWPELLAIVAERVKPSRDRVRRKARRERWWQFGDRQPGLYAAITGLDRVLFHGYTCQYLQFAFLPRGMVYAGPHYVFPFSTHAAFCTLQSRVHELWARFFSSTLEERLSYTPTDAFETFPFPPDWTIDPTLEAVGEAYYHFRADLMVSNNTGLTKTYNRFHDPDHRDPDITELRTLHAAMDRAVLDAYRWTDIPTNYEFLPEYEDDGDDGSSRRKKRYRYRWPDPVHDEVLARLMQLNAERAEEERRAASEEPRKQ